MFCGGGDAHGDHEHIVTLVLSLQVLRLEGTLQTVPPAPPVKILETPLRPAQVVALGLDTGNIHHNRNACERRGSEATDLSHPEPP